MKEDWFTPNNIYGVFSIIINYFRHFEVIGGKKIELYIYETPDSLQQIGLLPTTAKFTTEYLLG